ncbi:MAG TPA: hypothetical protein PL188_05615 [Candidatus Cloacimonadota bacterium]|mgnify:FL=1|nr:hypothetical protein [Candidatus Cloacimonadota bacterium]
MLTIDWKERLTLDTDDYLQHKLPKQDYDFEIIFIAYPERVNGKIPSDVITFVAGVIAQRMGKKHADFMPFYRHLWTKKGDYGKQAFATFLSKLTPKKPEIYLGLMEEVMSKADPHDINSLLDKVMLPLLRKHPEKYLSRVFAWTKGTNPELQKQALNLLIKLIKRREDLAKEVLSHIQHAWAYPLGDVQSLHVQLLKTIARLNPELYLNVWHEYGIYREPQIVELLCASVQDYLPQLEEILLPWTKSGNARVKKASNAAYKLLMKKKGA